MDTLEQLTKAEVMARLGKLGTLEYCDYYSIKLEKADEIRRRLFGTSDLTELGHKFKLPID
jgi:hypothetical protein